jgi:hypothetical protein
MKREEEVEGRKAYATSSSPVRLAIFEASVSLPMFQLMVLVDSSKIAVPTVGVMFIVLTV